ncbi:MAG: TolC family protein [Deltaproteobacteria bacterium]|nr:MAG: TolC family protein [Deltaproteobacteria bacterium]
MLLTDTVEVLEDGQKKLKQAESKLRKMLDELNEEVTDRDLFKLRYYGSQLEDWLGQARKGRQELLSVLRFLTGIEKLGNELQPAWRELDFEKTDVKPLEQYVQRAWSNRPEMRMMAAAEDAQRAAVEIERARLFPDFFLAGYVQASWSPVQDYIRNPLLQPGLTNYDAALAVGLQIELDVPRKLARLEQQKAELQRILARKRQLREAIRLEVERAWERLRAVQQRWKVQRRAHRAAKSWMRANLMSYGVGVYDTKDLLDSIAAYSRSSIELSRVKHDLAVSLDELSRAIGQDLRTGRQPESSLPAE